MIYHNSFKTQFLKLVEPNVQKPQLADVLKRNYLTGSALKLIEKEHDYVKIWERLRESFGNARLLLQNKLGCLDKIGGLNNLKGDDKIANALAGLTNAMMELSSLAEKHDLEGQLYEGGALEKVIVLIGRQRQRKFRSDTLNFCGSKKEEWSKLLEYLRRELRLHEKFVLDRKGAEMLGLSTPMSDKDKTLGKSSAHVLGSGEKIKCHICDKEGHTIVETKRGKKIIPYYACEKFAKFSAVERRAILESKGFCTTCLSPGAVKGPKHRCMFSNFCCPCPHPNGEKIHVLLCSEHKDDANHARILLKFKEKFILSSSKLPQYAKNIACFSNIVGITKLSQDWGDLDHEPDITDCAIYPLQRIEITGEMTLPDGQVKPVTFFLNLFFDGGCGEMVVSESAVDLLSSIGRAKQLTKGPLIITGVADQKSVCEKGTFSLCLPLWDGGNAVMSGLCIPKITATLPNFKLAQVEADLRRCCEEAGNMDLLRRFPKVFDSVGGDTHILLGSQYRRYFPKDIFETDTGLAVQQSVFKSPDGSRGVITGPHPVFSEIAKQCHSVYRAGTIFTEEFRIIREYSKLSGEAPLLGDDKPQLKSVDFDVPICCSMLDVSPVGEASYSVVLEISEDSDVSPVGGVSDPAGLEVPEDSDVSPLAEVSGPADLDVSDGSEVYVGKRPPKCIKTFEQVENSGTEVTYRCVDCRSCVRCKSGPRWEAVSIQEEIEQELIEKAVTVDPVLRRSRSRLPFIVPDPDNRLVDNEHVALKVYHRQIMKLSKSPEDKQAVLESEAKLQSLGFVDYVSNLSDEQKSLIQGDVLRNFIPWLAVWNDNSLSTPC